jgi:serine/threonine protein phosphatase PrpC
MMQPDTIARLPSIIEWAVQGRALAGEVESGDLHVIAPFSGGVLVAVMDGLGHGPEAAAAARLAAATLRDGAGAQVTDLMERCHQALHKSRGAVISIASFGGETGTMTWAGIGNVQGTLFRAAASASLMRESLLLRGGVVGYQMPRPRANAMRVHPGDILMFVTDGITSGVSFELSPELSPDAIATDILLHHARETDDALVLVARYVGRPS